MASPNIPHNAYTDAPQQHPNLILGSLQLLFWLFFRPKAWRNHLTLIFAALDLASDRTSRLLLELQIQIYLVLPLLVNLTLGLILWRLGKSAAENIVVWLTWGVTFSAWLSLSWLLIQAASNTKHSRMLIWEWLMGSALAVGSIGIVFGLNWVSALSVLLVLVVLLLGGLAFFGRFSWIWFFCAVAFLLVWLFVFGVPVLASGLSTLSLILMMILGILGIVSILSAAFGQYRAAIGCLSVCLCIILIMLSSRVLVLDLNLPIWGIGVTINLWRPVIFYPFVTLFNILLYQIDKQRKDNTTLLRWHSAFWDELQYIPLIGLDKHLILVIERNPPEGQAAVDYLNNSRQSWATQAAQIELDIRKLEHCADIEAISHAHFRLVTSELESSVNNLLNIFSRISQDVDAALNQKGIYNQRQILNGVVDRLNAHSQEIIRISNEYATRLYPIAQSWLNIINKHIEELIQATELLQEIDNPYIIGVPLNEQLEIFTGRTSIGLRIEQLLLDFRRPPLLLYGQRRMGKTSLLNNLGKLLPNTIIPMFVDLQGAPSSASNHAGFLYNLAREMVKSAKQQGVILLPLTREVLNSDPFTSFDEWLDKVEQKLKKNTALLMLDEFEVLDSAITKGRFDEQDILGMLRHLIQHRPRFKVLLAGSHTIEEYQRWASYLINVQVVHISYLKEAEARQLIERPVKDFTLRYEPDAVERVLQLTRCHPFLIQLLCAEIIALKNEQDPSVRRLATLADVEAAIPEAFKSGSFFFADIQNNQVDDHGRAILRFIAAQGEGAMVNIQAISQQFPNADITLKLLLQRELIEENGQDYCFSVELIRRWFTL
ncbi:ATP-binding protein [Calothrix membranacea FACHB-236]|nr:ATP-binding protein [Calothrix membranacea FACHB-236]